MSGPLSLATAIATMDRGRLERLVANRRVLSPTAVHEPLGLALELLRADSIARALQAAHREQLEALLELSAGGQPGGAVRDALLDAGLVGIGAAEGDAEHGELVPLHEVLAQLEEFGFAASESSAQASQRTLDTSGWFGPALTSVRRAAQLLRIVAEHPLRLGRKGRPAVTAVRELADALRCEAEPIDRLVDVVRAAGLLAESKDRSGTVHLIVSARAADWLALGYPERWLALAEAAAGEFDTRLRSTLAQAGGDLRLVVQRIPHDYPLLPEPEREGFRRLADCAEDLGLTVDGMLSPAASALLAVAGRESGARAALEIAEQQIPAPVAGVYLQPDLSLIVPGPLTPDDEAAVSAITETEQLGPAASLRLSASSLARAARRGFEPSSVRELLVRLSLTGIPQPLEYLLRDLERKLAMQAEAQPQYGEPPRSASRPRQPLPVARVADPRPGQRTESRSEQQAEPDAADGLAAMVERVLASSADAGDEGDLTRRLKLAIRDRSAVQVTAVAGADERVFTLLPVSLQCGRLRATDQQAGVERTLPGSAITAVDAA